MAHYDDIYDEIICPICNKTVDKYPYTIYINSYKVIRNLKLKPYEGGRICKKCEDGLNEKVIKENQEQREMDKDYQWIKEQGMEDAFREMALKEYDQIFKEQID
jgi:hypothetical protein